MNGEVRDLFYLWGDRVYPVRATHYKGMASDILHPERSRVPVDFWEVDERPDAPDPAIVEKSIRGALGHDLFPTKADAIAHLVAVNEQQQDDLRRQHAIYQQRYQEAIAEQQS